MQSIPQQTYAQFLLDNNVVGGGGGTDSQVNTAVLKAVNELITNASNKPVGADVAAIRTDNPARTLPAAVQRLFTSQPASSTSIVLLGEAHNDPADRQRAADYLAAMSATPPSLTPSLIVLERAIGYTPPVGIPVVREENLTTARRAGVQLDFGLQLTKSQRSTVVAGFLALCVASGNQQDINRIFMFYGANHDDIFKAFDYYVRHSSGFYVEKEIRNFFNISSNV